VTRTFDLEDSRNAQTQAVVVRQPVLRGANVQVRALQPELDAVLLRQHDLVDGSRQQIELAHRDGLKGSELPLVREMENGDPFLCRGQLWGVIKPARTSTQWTT
jgi:hypothetical protein